MIDGRQLCSFSQISADEYHVAVDEVAEVTHAQTPCAAMRFSYMLSLFFLSRLLCFPSSSMLRTKARLVLERSSASLARVYPPCTPD